MDLTVKMMKDNLLFSILTDDEFKSVCEKLVFTTKEFKKNEIIAHEDDYCNSIGLILDGSVEITRLYSNGKEVMLSKLSAKDVFGEAIIFSEADKYPATIMALSSCIVVYIEKEELLKLFTEQPKILRRFLETLSNKIVILNRKIKNSSFKNIRQRVINYILEKSHGAKEEVITLEDSKEKIALYLGIPRPSLSRELMNLRNLNYIDFDRHTIKILNLEGLEEEMFN